MITTYIFFLVLALIASVAIICAIWRHWQIERARKEDINLDGAKKQMQDAEKTGMHDLIKEKTESYAKAQRRYSLRERERRDLDTWLMAAAFTLAATEIFLKSYDIIKAMR